MRRAVAFGLGAVLLCARGVDAQGARVIPGFGVDTTAPAWAELAWHAAVPEIYAAWSEYLRTDRALQKPTRHWSAAEQQPWPAYDLTTLTGTYAGFPATVLDVRPRSAGSTDEYVVKTLFASVSGSPPAARPVALTRVYAIRENGRWVFSNALLRHAADWPRETVGPITYVTRPGRPLNRERAERAVAFADSVAVAFGVPEIDGLTYYVADDPEELHRLIGIDWTFGGLGHGYAQPASRLVLNGNPVYGEENRHELAHVLLAPLAEAGRAHPIITEGAATWLGGSLGSSFRELMVEYATYLRLNPEVTVDTLLDGSSPDKGWSPTGALLVLLAFEHGGVDAVKALFTAGRRDDELRTAISRLLGLEWGAVMERVRARGLAFRPDTAGS